MHTKFRIRHFAHKTLLTFLGPAHLDEHNDPMRKLDRERDEVLGPRKKKESKLHIPRRHFSETAKRDAKPVG